MIDVRPVKTPDELRMLHEKAQQEGHGLAFPSHTIWRSNTECVGALSIVPAVLVWTNKTVTPRESDTIRAVFEGIVSNQSRVICVPCLEVSPYFPLLPRLNYVDMGKMNIFVKGV